jgi:hypothetical protein
MPKCGCPRDRRVVVVGRKPANGARPLSALFSDRGRDYGDCKDKANLMRALLKAAGVRAFLLTVYATDADDVQAEWPSPQQFNPCILAIQLADAGAGRASFRGNTGSG